MMGPVADDEQPKRDQPGPPPAVPGGPPPSPAPGGAGQPPVVPGESYDAEQWRRFQEFQEFQRFEEANPPPSRGKPLWRRLVFNRWVRRLVFLLILLVGAAWSFDHYFGNPDEDLPASMTGGFQETRTVIHAPSPAVAMRLLYKEVAGGADPMTRTHACHRFETPELAQRFADHFSAPSCDVAVKRLSEEVTNASAYARPVPSAAIPAPGPDGSVVISSCEVGVTGGTPLGEFTFQIIPDSIGDQWIITDHRKEAAGCR